jgi:hypothetical protein
LEGGVANTHGDHALALRGVILVAATAMKLPESRFDGIFANASLFHVPSQELPRVLAGLSETLRSLGRFAQPL